MTYEETGAELVPVSAPAPAPPAPLLAGTFALYETPDGGFCLVTDVPGRGVEQRIVSGKLVRMLTSGKGAGMLGKMFGLGEG